METVVEIIISKETKVITEDLVSEMARIQKQKNRYEIKKVTIPESVTKIGEAAFTGCTSLTSINIPDSVTEIERFAFNICVDYVFWFCWKSSSNPVEGRVASRRCPPQKNERGFR